MALVILCMNNYTQRKLLGGRERKEGEEEEEEGEEEGEEREEEEEGKLTLRMFGRAIWKLAILKAIHYKAQFSYTRTY